MKKVETPAQVEKRKYKEAKELKKLLKISNSPSPRYYFWVLFVVLAVVYVIDEVSTNINTSMQSFILIDLFNITGGVNSAEYAEALTQVTFLGLISAIAVFVLPFYKSLADKYGRRIFLVINTIGMALGMFLVMLANNLAVYILGVLIITFVTPNDVQLMYIMEVSPAKHRAKLANIAKACGILGISSIGLLRHIFITDDVSSWRMVYLIPAIVGAAVGLLALVFVKETPIFVEQRINYLNLTDEQRKEQEEKQKAESESQGGVVPAFKFMFKHKQLRNIAIAGFLFFFSTMATNFYETIMSSTMDSSEVSTAILCYPFLYAAFTVFSGLLADKIGRKKTILICGVSGFAGLLGFILCSKYVGNGVLSGLLYGLFVGGLWSMSDILNLVTTAESSPTNLRASVVADQTLIVAISGIVGSLVVTVLQNFLDLGWLCFGFGVPFMAISIILVIKNVKETKDVNLDTVTGCEWD